MRKPIFKALIVGLIFIFVYYAFQTIRGIYLTINYEPEIAETYKSVDYLQHKVAFGYILNPAWVAFEVLVLMLLGIIAYYMARVMKRKK